MFVTSLNFEEILKRFYRQNKYDFLLLFVSSFDGRDEEILRKVVDNAKRIDRITGERICFFYFVEERYDWMNERITKWVKDIPSFKPLYGEGVSITMNMADEICQYFGVLRSDLPAFLLIDRKDHSPRLYSIQNYNDFEEFLTPLNIIHSYIEDKECILKQFEHKRTIGIVTQQEVDKRSLIRHSWNIAIQQLEKKQKRELALGLNEKAEARNAEILKFKNKLTEFPLLKVKGADESIQYPYNYLSQIELKAIQRLEIALNTHRASSIINNINSNRYKEALIEIWDLISSKKVRLSNILEKIRLEINERGFDIFISCKSQDYTQAYELYNFLKNNGYNPFLADVTIKEIGVDQYTALIGEVINVCESMIVFATDVNYLLTPYVYAEWNLFINDINTGRKPKAKIITILSSNIDVHTLPSWLRDKQSFTIDSYKLYLLPFLKGRSSDAVSYIPFHKHTANSWFSFFRRNKTNIYSSIFAPAQIQPMKTFIVRVYLYKPEESKIVDTKVRNIDPEAQKKEYKPLDIPVKKGDRLTIQLKMSGGVEMDSNSKSVIWHNHFTDCSFMAKLTDVSVDNVYGTAYVCVNGIPAGELLFTIDVVSQEEKALYAKVESRRYSRIFISYSYADKAQVRGFAECCRALGTDYFFDRHSLQAGDVFKDKILNYIDNADLFVLCWSENAAKSEWVQIEREHALSLIKEGKTKLSIYPLCLKPEAPLPLEMSDKYKFGAL